MLFEVTQSGHHGNIAELTKAESLLNMKGARSAGHVMWVIVSAIRGRWWEGRMAARDSENDGFYLDVLCSLY